MGIKTFFSNCFNPKDKEGRPLGDASNATYQNVGASYGTAGGAGLGVLQPDGVVGKKAIRTEPAAASNVVADVPSAKTAGTTATTRTTTTAGTTSAEKSVGRKETVTAPSQTTELSQESEGKVEDQLYSTQVEDRPVIREVTYTYVEHRPVEKEILTETRTTGREREAVEKRYAEHLGEEEHIVKSAFTTTSDVAPVGAGTETTRKSH
ncbi:hypothetical protein ACKKBG_A34420 [Auxenochlorella protothecoides x Auxenochlorella symbiontica]|uniref:Uncharacterized protein n=1 Tax=Auxenochlorella protothecoides TaxID=3075 RepID=A0A1D1ZUE4_AUXPR